MMSEAEILADFDAEIARLRRTLGPEARAEFDRETAIDRAELLAKFKAIDAEEDEEAAPAAVSTLMVDFCQAGSPCRADGVVRRKGVIWRAGSYEDHRFEMSPAELAEYARTFVKVPIDAGHPSTASPLDGLLGELESVEVAPDGRTLLGTVALPAWLEQKLGDARRFVSASFDRLTKRIRRLSLVTHPHFSDAELHAAFSTSSARPSGRIGLIRNLLATAPGRDALAQKGINLDPMAAALPEAQLESLLRFTPAGRDALSRTIF